MRNFFRQSAQRKKNTRNSSTAGGTRFLDKTRQQMLDTDEDRVINQYNFYREYILMLRKRLTRPLNAGLKSRTA